MIKPRGAIASFLGVIAIAISAVHPAWAEHKPAASIPASALIEPADFAATLTGTSATQALVLQVGFRKAYTQAHIPGSEYVGAASEEEGLAALRQRVDKLPKDRAIVIYCGCCPWKKCPNIAAAYDALQALGFTNVKVMHIAEDFGTNWVDKGFPTAKDL